MRHNKFGDVYCHNADEIDTVMADKDIYYGDIHADVYLDEDNPGQWMAEVRFNEDGETAFWCEGFNDKKTLTDALIGVGLDRRDIQSRV